MSGTAPGPFTELLRRVSGPDAAESLIPLVYDELRQLARIQMAGERTGHTLQATALVHEAYARLFRGQRLPWSDRTHFLNAAAAMMRQLLREHARNRGRIKRGGKRRRVPLDVVELACDTDVDEVQVLDDALERLEQQDRRTAEVVKLRFFAGLATEEIAAALDVSDRTVRREWKLARAWLARELGVERAAHTEADDP